MTNMYHSNESNNILFDLRHQVEQEALNLRKEMEGIKVGYEQLDLKNRTAKEELNELGGKLCLLQGRARVKKNQINQKRNDIRVMRWKSFEIQQENDALKSQLLTIEKQGVNVADIRRRYNLQND
ncbi:unnamed protein product [Dimorphilus gyrociliatus]|uniref:Uncharacterized protein n=1 Tax=Dimorphilus gyrociliatus TaxID=2664684 RepID=A0A7I8VL47_9ANNE|nr:unnamed protein product [Dimorphilus gyrociliatus]